MATAGTDGKAETAEQKHQTRIQSFPIDAKVTGGGRYIESVVRKLDPYITGDHIRTCWYAYVEHLHGCMGYVSPEKRICAQFNSDRFGWLINFMSRHVGTDHPNYKWVLPIMNNTPSPGEVDEKLINQIQIHGQAAGVAIPREKAIETINVVDSIRVDADFAIKEEIQVGVLEWLLQNGHGEFISPKNSATYAPGFMTESKKVNPNATVQDHVKYGVLRWMETCLTFAKSKGYIP